MKTKLILLLTLGLAAMASAQGLNSKIASAEPKTAYYKWVTLTTSASTPASTTNLSFTAASFYGIKAASTNAAPTANTQPAYFGYKDTTGEVATINTAPVVESLAASARRDIANTGTKYNLADFYFTGTTGDKVLIVYYQ